MAVLRSPARVLLAIGACALGGCYAPDLQDCAVSCRAADDCGPGQVCGGDGMCAAPAIAGQCGAHLDAGADRPDARGLPDASPDAAPLDGPPARFVLTVKISGRGRVLVTEEQVALGQCDHTAVNATCAFEVRVGAQLQLTAMGLFGDEFDKWTSLACAGQDATCDLTVVVLTTSVVGKFAD